MKNVVLCLLSLTLTACGPQGAPKDAAMLPVEAEGDVVAPIMEFNFDHQGTNYVIRLEDTRNGKPGDVVVMGFDPASANATPERLAEVARAVCVAEGRQFDGRALVRRENEGRVWTFVGACL